jgi:hypothetical protein
MQSGGELRDNPLLNNDCNFVHVQQLVCVTGGHCGRARNRRTHVYLWLFVYVHAAGAAKSIYVRVYLSGPGAIKLASSISSTMHPVRFCCFIHSK